MASLVSAFTTRCQDATVRLAKALPALVPHLESFWLRMGPSMSSDAADFCNLDAAASTLTVGSLTPA